MNPNLTRPATLVFALLVLAACGDTPTEPQSAISAAPEAELAAASSPWVAKADMPSIERIRLTTAVVQNASGQSILYAIGGATASTLASLGKVMAYNASTNTWSYKASLPVPLYWTNGAVTINGKIYVSGGLSGHKGYRDELFMYDPAKNTWTQKKSMPNTTFRGVSGVINNRLYVLTGCAQEDCTFFIPLAFYRYDPATDQWTTLTPPSGQFSWGPGGVIGGKFYVTGAQDGATRLMVYDPATATWTQKTPLNNFRGRAGSVTLGGKLYVIGGGSSSPDGSSILVRTVSIYDPTTDTWTNKAPLPAPRADLSASRVVVNGRARIELVGGLRPGNNLQYTP